MASARPFHNPKEPGEDDDVLQAGPRKSPVQFHDQIAAEWDHKYTKTNFQSRQVAFEKCLPSRHLSGRWLDAGCGTGFLSRWIANRGATVESVDLSPRMLEFFNHHRKHFGKKHLLKEPQVANIEFLPCSAESFNGIICSSVLEYVDDPAAALREFRRVLAPGGWLTVSIPNRVSLLRRGLETAFRLTSLFGKPWPAYIEFSVHRYTASEFESLLRSCGFESKGFAGCGTSLPGLRNTPLGWSLLVFGAIKKA